MEVILMNKLETYSSIDYYEVLQVNRSSTIPQICSKFFPSKVDIETSHSPITPPSSTPIPTKPTVSFHKQLKHSTCSTIVLKDRCRWEEEDLWLVWITKIERRGLEGWKYDWKIQVYHRSIRSFLKVFWIQKCIWTSPGIRLKWRLTSHLQSSISYSQRRTQSATSGRASQLHPHWTLQRLY